MKTNPLVLHSPSLSLHLDTSQGLSAITLENLLTGHTFSLGGQPELELDWDAAVRRIWIEGWRCRKMDPWEGSPDEERGFREGFARADFDDSHLVAPYPDSPETFPMVEDRGEWECFESPCDLHLPDPRQ